MTTAVIVQARMTSHRLPGKVMAPVLGRPLLAYLIERLARTRADRVVVATTTNDADRPIATLAASMGAEVFRGSEDDVLDRYRGAARMVDATTVVRVTADCPLLEPATVDALVRFHLLGGFDHSAAEGLPDGMACEAISREALEIAAREATDRQDREHVTMFTIRRPTRFRLGRMRSAVDRPAVRLTVDEPADLDLVRRIIESLYPRTPRFTLDDILWTLSGHPEWIGLNAHVRNTVYDQTPVTA